MAGYYEMVTNNAGKSGRFGKSGMKLESKNMKS
jgi:hypothetical protein